MGRDAESKKHEKGRVLVVEFGAGIMESRFNENSGKNWHLAISAASIVVAERKIHRFLAYP